jgi:hypothetical protein
MYAILITPMDEDDDSSDITLGWFVYRSDAEEVYEAARRRRPDAQIHLVKTMKSDFRGLDKSPTPINTGPAPIIVAAKTYKSIPECPSENILNRLSHL